MPESKEEGLAMWHIVKLPAPKGQLYHLRDAWSTWDLVRPPIPPTQFPTNVPGRQGMMAQLLKCPSSTWEAKMEFLAPNFGLAKPWLLLFQINKYFLKNEVQNLFS